MYYEDTPIEFDIVTGDDMKRLTPGTSMNINSTKSWLVSQGFSSRRDAEAHLRRVLAAIQCKEKADGANGPEQG